MGVMVSQSPPFVTKIPEDSYVAICVGVYDIGTVFNKKFSKEEHKVILVWELPELTDDRGVPMTINKTYTASLGEKAFLRQDLTSWRGRAFTEVELAKFDLSQVLGKPCQLVVIHNRDGQSVYANIQTVSSVPKGFKAPSPHHPVLSFTFGEDAEIPPGVPEWVAKKIQAAPEWGRRRGSPPEAGSNGTGESEEGDEDIPF